MRDRNDGGHELCDDPGQALESGEPGEVGRAHGHLIDDHGLQAGRGNPEPHPGEDRDDQMDWESGRHEAAP